MDNKLLQRLFSDFEDLEVLVIGDTMVDRYYTGIVDRISPEAPVPVVKVTGEDARLGGAANVALNIKSLGATPILCAIYGNDDAGDTLLDLLTKSGLSHEGMVSVPRPTTVKTRVIGNNHQMIRVDREVDDPLDKTHTVNLVDRIKKIIEDRPIKAIVFEDYDKGVITPLLITEVVKIAQARGIPTSVDPKSRNYHAFKGVTLFKPNLKELREGSGIDLKELNEQSLIEATRKLCNDLNADQVFVTLSEHGVFITNGNEHYMEGAHRRDISDVSGAGDTVISVATLCMALECDMETTAQLSNLAGGLVCEKVGVVPIDRDELFQQALNL